MDRLREVASVLKATYGKGVIGSASSRATKDRRFSTGSLSLDAGLGGGIPVGRSTMFFGEKSGGKTTSAIRVLGIVQGLCRRCLRPATDLSAVEPSADELREDDGARWSAKAKCDCFKEGLIDIEDPAKGSGEGSKVFRERVAKWRSKMESNSYEEMICCFVDPEDSFDSEWSKKLGADPDRIFFVKSSTGEEGVDIVTALIASGHVDFFVIDSLAHFTPSKEYEESAEKWQQGLQARIINKGIRKWVTGGIQAKRDGTDVTQIWINQTRMKIGVMFGDPTVKPGGKGQDFAAHAEVRFMLSKEEVIEDQFGSKKETVSMNVSTTFRFKITKNKTAPTKGYSGDYTMLTRDNDVACAGTIMEDEYLFKLAMHYLVEKTKTGYSIGEGLEFTSQKGIMERIRDDSDLRKVVRSTVLNRMLTGVK